MTSARQKKAHDAWMRELGEWKARETAAEGQCAAITDIEELTAALRDLLLARADHLEFRQGRREVEAVALWRRRANSEAYRRTMAVWMIAKRLMAEADKEHGFTKAEREERDARYTAESAALRGAIDAMLRSIRTS